MNLQKIFVPVVCLLLLGGAWRSYGWQGVALVGGGLMMWVLLHYTRLLTILKRAADRPIGFVASAVMLNAKLRKGMTLMHVIAMTRSLGALQSSTGGPMAATPRSLASSGAASWWDGPCFARARSPTRHPVKRRPRRKIPFLPGPAIQRTHS